jgi:hypothetical protein
LLAHTRLDPLDDARDGGGRLGEAGPHALVARTRTIPMAINLAHRLQVGEHVGHRAHVRGHRIDGGHLRHALAACRKSKQDWSSKEAKGV